MQAPAFGIRSASDRLGAWNFYFVAKLALLALGLIGLHLVENLAFAAVLFAFASPKLRRWRPWLGVPVAIALLYYDSYLPSFARVVSQASLITSFSGAYLMELAGRFVSWKVVAILAAALAAYLVIARFMRLDVFVVAAMVAMGLLMTAPPQPTSAGETVAVRGVPPRPQAAQNPDARLTDFFQKESQRAVAFAKPPDASPPFDVIFLHVCSLSWDDLEATGMKDHPLFARFDIVLRRFNGVSTYSGPAAIRFLRAPCGQPPHKALYGPARPQCLLMSDLQQAGLEEQLVMNHDGHFDDFLLNVKAQGVDVAPLALTGLAAPMRSFDDSRIYDDAAVLARWLEGRAKGSPRAAVYYNTVSLHDGNRLLTDVNKKSSETYKVRLAKLLDDLDGFMGKLEASGRRAVVVLVPEHGAAWRGDAAQIAGLRELPTPAITLVPVAVKVIGPDAKRNGGAVAVNEPTSYLALSHIVARMLDKPPFGAAGFAPGDYVAGLPTTDFVSEGETATVVLRDKSYWIRQERDAWKELR